jgi:hypothetical protein
MLVSKIEFAATFKNEIVETVFTEFADKGGADEAIVAGDDDFGRRYHET